MELKDLHIFVTLAKEQNTTKTAEVLNYVQSNITARIKKLEKEFQTELFFRQPRGMTLTPKGRQLLQYAEQILALVDETTLALINDEMPHGTLRIGTNETTASSRLPNLLVDYSKNYPDVELSLRVGTTKVLLDDIFNYQLDGAFMVGPVEHPELVTTEIFTEELVLYSSSPITPGDVQHKTLLTRPYDLYRERLETWMTEEEIYPRRIMEFNTIESILNCVNAGLGFSIAPISLVDSHRFDRPVSFYDIPEPHSHIQIIFVHRKDMHVDSALKKFISMAEQLSD
ncbi:LysR family transcriptional regulator [Geomicrobium sp. JCM 19039]|uniref:LysR family transcriptional regulator n=1 Tax=Geomicrobium sp. JCM 19039 TaxID=1460636 RepID=UPI00045F4787|nr:LysR family transcriptional regulator [Geomicrobium sp. JCM 19039]GAK13269.1 transcriptional regulator, LysR family [Geomicrobium sp. JCM 19039]